MISVGESVFPLIVFFCTSCLQAGFIVATQDCLTHGCADLINDLTRTQLRGIILFVSVGLDQALDSYILSIFCIIILLLICPHCYSLAFFFIY